MVFYRSLKSFHIVENESIQESKNINLITWTYPSIEDDVRKLITSTCFTLFQNSNVYFCIRSKTLWIYVYQGFCNKKCKAVVLTAKEFYPKKYKVLCYILFREYTKHENPAELVKLYLKIFIKGSCVLQENGAPLLYDYDNFKSERGLKGLINLLGAEITHIYNAILLKRRVLVYHQNIETLQQVLYTVICLVPNRSEDEYLEPFIEDVKQLKGRSYYTAGTTNNTFIDYSDCYDIFVNLVTPEIRISPQAKEALAITEVHKDIASSIVELNNNGKTEEEIINKIKMKTKYIIGQLESFVSITENGMKIITVNDLKNKKLSPSTENFYFHLAVAEDMMML